MKFDRWTDDGVGQRTRRSVPVEVIAKAQRHLTRRAGIRTADATFTCWACLRRTPDLEKAHVFPVRFGGSDHPRNFFLLCGVCHFEQPDDAPRREQLRWLREHKNWVEASAERYAAFRREFPPLCTERKDA